MYRDPIFLFIKRLNRPIFTTSELSAFSGKSCSSVVQALRFLERRKAVINICRGVWAEAESQALSPYLIIPFLFPRQRVYVSFISALHLYGIVEQIPQVITLASIGHTKTIHTKMGVYSVHKISPYFFDGFGWYKDKGNFLIAEPEKALVDCLYLSAYKKKQFSYFPELYVPKAFSFKKAKEWAKMIPNPKVSLYVLKKIAQLQS